MSIASDVVLGIDGRIPRFALGNLYGRSAGDRTRIAAFVKIREGSLVGALCKISSHSFICESVQIEYEVSIGQGVMFTNDIYCRATQASGLPQSETDWVVFPTMFKRSASIESDATLIAEIPIGEGALVEAGAVVCYDILVGAIAGVPERPVVSKAARTVTTCNCHS
jgi:UDP-2-acetamido-3-amino-2,3-dideoxy-glucuronate N-acetyltransferase